MGEAQQIGDVARGVIARTAQMMAFQQMLTRCPSPDVRESFIRSAWSHDVLSEDEAATLLRLPENHGADRR
jgi:hypothetical protein